jgi:hypothetical protein
LQLVGTLHSSSMSAEIEVMKCVERQDANFSLAAKSDEKAAGLEGETNELRKDFGLLSLGALCLALMATWEAGLISYETSGWKKCSLHL